jgi:hypothetical protein
MRKKKLTQAERYVGGGECESCGCQTRELHPTTFEYGLACFCCWERLQCDDQFAPPPTPVDVWCIHCGSEYRSDAMFEDNWGFWRCGIPGCDGRGFGFDVWRVGDGLPRPC